MSPVWHQEGDGNQDEAPNVPPIHHRTQYTVLTAQHLHGDHIGEHQRSSCGKLETCMCVKLILSHILVSPLDPWATAESSLSWILSKHILISSGATCMYLILNFWYLKISMAIRVFRLYWHYHFHHSLERWVSILNLGCRISNTHLHIQNLCLRN